MAITKMNKFTLICFRENKKDVLKNLQKIGNSEFINLQTDDRKEDELLSKLSSENVSVELQEVDSKLALIKSSIRFLESYSPKESMFKVMKLGKEDIDYESLSVLVKNTDWESCCNSLKNTELRLAAIESEVIKLRDEIAMLNPWYELDIPIESIKDSLNVKSFIGNIPVSKGTDLSTMLKPCSLCKFTKVNEDNQFQYIVVFVHDAEAQCVKEILRKNDFSDMKISYLGKPRDIVVNINSKIDELKREKNKILDCLKSDNSLGLLKKCEEYFGNIQLRLQANQNFLRSKTSVIISGWNPAENNLEIEEAINLATKGEYVLNFEEVKESEDLEVPVKLKNNRFFKAFESITEMYSLPNYKGLDPTPLLAPFYMLFFGMMVGDFGYGAMITLACVLALKVFNLDESSKNFAKLFMWLGVSTTGWGLVYGAGFGDKIQFDSLLNMNTDIMTIMGLSIGFGVFQILVALFVKAYMLIRTKQYFAAFADVGLWLITFVGIAMFAMGVSIGKWIMICGMVGIVITNGRESSSTAGKLAEGAYALYGITNYVGDLVSYTRLMALGVAGGSIASAMNLIIGYLPSNIIVVLIIAPLLFVAVHVFNLLLGALGAYVHSCRLQYVEYFGKFYDGGGKAFKPLKMQNKHINVK